MSKQKLLPFAWPFRESRASQLVELCFKLETFNTFSIDQITDTGYGLESLPKTLRRLALEFPRAASPFLLSDLLVRETVQTQIDEQLPGLEYLSLKGHARGSFLLIPKSVTRFSFLEPSDGIHIPDLAALPPHIKHLIIPDINLYEETALALPHTLETLDFRMTVLNCAPRHLTSLTAYRIIIPRGRNLSYPPNLTHLKVSAEVGWPWDDFPDTLTSLHMDYYYRYTRSSAIKLPPNLVKWTTNSDKRPVVAVTVDFSEEVLTSLPPLLQTLSLAFTNKIVPKLMQYLPTGLTSLDMRYSKIPIDEYSLLPLSLTELFVPSYSSANAKYIERLVNLREFGAFGGIVSAKSLKQLPRGITAIQFHGVALDIKTQKRWKLYQSALDKQAAAPPPTPTPAAQPTLQATLTSKPLSASKQASSLKAARKAANKAAAASKPATSELKPELNAFHGTLPPNLTKLVVFHYCTHLYYYEHAAEIYKDLPVSLEELHLIFWEDRKRYNRQAPNRTRPPSHIILQDIPGRGPVYTPVTSSYHYSPPVVELSTQPPKSKKITSPYSAVYAPPVAKAAPSAAASSSASSSASWKNTMFSRLINLRVLTVDYPAAASYDHSLIEMPSSGSLKYLYYQCWLSFTEEDLEAIPSSVVAFGANTKSYSQWLNQTRYRHPYSQPYIEYYCRKRHWYMLY